MIFDSKAEQAVVFINGNQLESLAIAGFFRLCAASLCVCLGAVGVIASAFDRLCGTADVAIIAAQIKRPGDAVAAREKDEAGSAEDSRYF
jgi:hypothetical protein